MRSVKMLFRLKTKKERESDVAQEKLKREMPKAEKDKAWEKYKKTSQYATLLNAGLTEEEIRRKTNM